MMITDPAVVILLSAILIPLCIFLNRKLPI